MLTEEQKQKLREAGYNEAKISAFERQRSGLKKGIIAETTQDLSQIGTDIKSSYLTRAENVRESVEAKRGGEQGVTRTFLQGLGQSAGLVSDVLGAGFKGAIKAVLPQSGEEKLKSGVSAIAQPIVKSDTVQSIISRYKQLDPKTQRDIDALIGVGSLALDVTGLGVAGKGAKVGTGALKTGAKQVAGVSDDLVKKTKQIFSNTNARIGDQILPIPETVKTTLKRTSDDTLRSYVNQAKNATFDQKAMTPLELAGEKATAALEQVQKRLSSIGQQKSSIIAQSNVGLKPVGNIAVKARQDILKQISNKTLDVADRNLVNDILEKLTRLGNNPKLSQVDEFIDYAQETLYKGSKNLTVPVGGRTEAVLKNVITNLNNQIKSVAPGSYSTLNAKYSAIIDIRNSLNKALGTDASKGGSLMKRVFSPTDGGTKKLFEDVKKLTGVDLTDEAVLAKFAMDLFGDARQASILQQLNLPSQRGLIEKTLQIGGKVLGIEDFIRKATIKRAGSLVPKK